ncbi:RNA-directed DNA polymerase, eukaryota, reverse transcriptase zinc-binding domain protein, partial [Tanacetum coccineum]
SKLIIIISIYAPKELFEKKISWEYLIYVIGNWNGDVVIMGDFNEVRTQKERYGTVFNVKGAKAFNSFISVAGLEEIRLVYGLSLRKIFPTHKKTLKAEIADIDLLIDKGEGDPEVLNKRL